jgi:hypothetical protein
MLLHNPVDDVQDCALKCVHIIALLLGEDSHED